MSAEYFRGSYGPHRFRESACRNRWNYVGTARKPPHHAFQSTPASAPINASAAEESQPSFRVTRWIGFAARQIPHGELNGIFGA